MSSKDLWAPCPTRGAIPEPLGFEERCGVLSGARRIPVGWGRFGLRETLESDTGERLELECVAGPSVYTFQLFYTGPDGRYRVGLCPSEAGCNEGFFMHSGDQNRNGKPDCFVSTYWRSRDFRADDDGDGLIDHWTGSFNAANGNLTKSETEFDYSIGPPINLTCAAGARPEGTIRDNRPVDPPLGPQTEAYFTQLSDRLQQQPPGGQMDWNQGSWGDLNRDGSNDDADLAVFEAAYGRCSGQPQYNPELDFDLNGCVGETDRQAWFQLAGRHVPGNQAPEANCRDTVQADADNSCMASVEATAVDNGSSDPDSGDSLTFTLSPPGPFGLGDHAVVLSVADTAGHITSCGSIVQVRDVTPPFVSSLTVDHSTLWPPNHQMRHVNVDYEVSDNCAAPSAIPCTLAIVSSEPINGTGDGDTAPDWDVLNAHAVRLRAERAGGGNGRIYTITAICGPNGAGVSSAASVTVPRHP